MMNISFQKEGDQWFAVLPEWEGSKDELEMVCNADLMCDILAQGENIVHAQLTLEPSLNYKAKLTKSDFKKVQFNYRS